MHNNVGHLSFVCTMVLPVAKGSDVRVSRSMPVFFYRGHISTLLQHICIKFS